MQEDMEVRSNSWTCGFVEIRKRERPSSCGTTFASSGKDEQGSDALVLRSREVLWPSCRFAFIAALHTSTTLRGEVVYRRTGLVQEPVPLYVFDF